MAQNSIFKPAVTGSCSICLNLGHRSSNCPGKIRCWTCLKFGHTWKRCMSRYAPTLSWQPKSSMEIDCTRPRSRVTRVKPCLVWISKTEVKKPTDILDSRVASPDSPSSLNQEHDHFAAHHHPPQQSQSSSPHPENPNTHSQENPTPSPPSDGDPITKSSDMANFPVNPRPFLVGDL